MPGLIYVSYIGQKGYKYSNVVCGSGHIITEGSTDVPQDLQNIRDWLQSLDPNANIAYNLGPNGVILFCDRDIIATDPVSGNEYNPLTLSSPSMSRSQIRAMYNVNAGVNIVINTNIIRD